MQEELFQHGGQDIITKERYLVWLEQKKREYVDAGGTVKVFPEHHPPPHNPAHFVYTKKNTIQNILRTPPTMPLE